MRAGKLDKIIKIETYAADDRDEWGAPVEVWTALGTYRAHIVQGSNEEFFKAQGIVDQSAIIFRIRYVPNLQLADRVVYAGSYYNISEIIVIGRNHGLDIRTVSTGESVP
ncbi:phage head closure protein [Devosia rhodophyticola]|uniref:Phage head closure protein n=1 Tax=Devosia rhodophyticola TaxID=3026423 RepID=A0ABY7Z0W8_9HYPH|nr:phage head closure protein [Devosia rhodophyticola]WDR07298.1 phage head closure protein [Devosia rhodophyticola]